LVDGNGMVIVMNDNAREILNQARETLHRVRDVVVEYRDDGVEELLSRAKREPLPTVAEIRGIIDDRVNEVEQKLDERIAAALCKHDEDAVTNRTPREEVLAKEVMIAVGEAFAEERKWIKALVADRVDAVAKGLTKADGTVIDLPAFVRKRTDAG
jgi:hypothetical protein